MIENCDMCGTKIEDGKCSCGTWQSPEETANCPMKAGIEKFHEMKQFTFTADAPHLGCAVIYFRGDYRDCKHLEKMIHLMKERPNYEAD